MATDHNGNIVGNPATSHGGHRPTPRLAQALSQHLLVESVMSNDELTNKNPLLNSIKRPPVTDIRRSDAQDAINSYRDLRDGNASIGRTNDRDQKALAKNLNTVIGNRDFLLNNYGN